MIKLQTKELGVRKILGATSTTIWKHITMNYLKLVMVAVVIAWPFAFFIMNKWLENFAYRTDFSVWPFVISGILTLGIAIITVIWQSYKAATANPIEALKFE